MFAATLLVNALLLFLVQPIIARMLLPYLGGTPAVWNTCMVFFQTLLLAGYAYSHFITQRLSVRTQTILHLSLLALAKVDDRHGQCSRALPGFRFTGNRRSVDRRIYDTAPALGSQSGSIACLFVVPAFGHRLHVQPSPAAFRSGEMKWK